LINKNNFSTSSMSEKKSISISSKNFNEISNKIKNPVNDFSSVDEYVDYVLNEILFEQENENISDTDKERVKDELKKLGYI
jgi:hypothetical protein